MIKDCININSEVFLEERSIAIFVQNANMFRSNIRFEFEDKAINAKSIMGIYAINLLNMKSVNLVVDGEDEKEAFENLKNFLSR